MTELFSDGYMIQTDTNPTPSWFYERPWLITCYPWFDPLFTCIRIHGLGNYTESVRGYRAISPDAWEVTRYQDRVIEYYYYSNFKTLGDSLFHNLYLVSGYLNEVRYVAAFVLSAYPYGISIPVANFTAAPTYGLAPLAVQFLDTSAGNPTSWTWDFGDGSVSHENTPSHVYDIPGVYTVSLYASNSAGFSTKTIPNTIIVVPSMYEAVLLWKLRFGPV
ncbi:MAG: PKD domain-containing protein [Dehalococcoidia bacterium]|jgi:PKD repeat protein